MRTNDLLQCIWLFAICMTLLEAACHNNCNKNGRCNKFGECKCFTGYEGNDCSRKSCPVGARIADIPYSTDSAHQDAECSGRGTCDYSTGLCNCYHGYSGNSCQRLDCFNGCSGHGTCLSLRQAAELNDGYQFNRTTKYTNWDADLFTGCKCDPGWSGADCSQRQCEYGIDPRTETSQYEIATLVCKCTSTCSGKFKLRYKGIPSKNWISASARSYEVANALMTIPDLPSNISLYDETGVVAYNSTYDTSICASSSARRTRIKFRRNGGDMPAISFYSRQISGGQVYFETTQMLVCDCVNFQCDGSFRLSFDGEMSSQFTTSSTPSAIATALADMTTIQSAWINVTYFSTGSTVCTSSAITNTSLIFTASFGNIPRLGLWSSITDGTVYSTDNTAGVLRLLTNDGRDDSVGICNGVGTCDFSSGQCRCALGFTSDPDLGPCGKVFMNSSDWGGLGRCPGAVSADDLNDRTTLSDYQSRLFISIDPVVNTYVVPASGETANHTISTIEVYDWYGELPDLQQKTQNVFLNLSSNSSAGPIVIDNAKNRMYFVDNNPAYRFIGYANLTQEDSSGYVIWLHVTYKIFGLAIDAHFKTRRLFWSVPGNRNSADGSIYWAYLDSTTPTATALTSTIGQTHVVDPMGIAWHGYQQRLYWIDRNLSMEYSVLRSCDYDGSNYKQMFLYRTVDGKNVSTNVTDLVLDYNNNNTAFFLDTASPASLIGTNLDAPVYLNSDSYQEDQFKYMETHHVVCDTYDITMTKPYYLAIDTYYHVLIWSDISEKKVKFSRYIKEVYDPFSPGVAYKPYDVSGFPKSPYIPRGLAIDQGLGSQSSLAYLECFGHGRCLGLDNNWKCECDKGYFGNCNMKHCPKGPAWFHEPVKDNIAHDEDMECSNMGVCDYLTGRCNCRPGFSGPACERMDCNGATKKSWACNGAGRCLSMKELATYHRDTYGNLDSVSYGDTPRDPSTWDATMIQGCLADEYGYYHDNDNNMVAYIAPKDGDALERFTCPLSYRSRRKDVYGMDSPSTATYSSETQTLSCKATGGSFSLSFRGYETSDISYSATISVLKSRLEALQSINKVDIVYSGGTSTTAICGSSSASTIYIEFTYQVGSIALMQIESNSLTHTSTPSLSISRLVQGFGKTFECSGNGECDRSTGVCECWDNYGSSDGYGNQGSNGDCGYNLIV